MEVFEDVGALYCEYVKHNKEDVMSELEFFKSAFKDAMNEMDTLRQQYHTLNEQFNNKKVESSYYAEEVVQIQTDNKSLTEELVTLKVQEKAYKEKYSILKTKNEILEEDNLTLKTKNDALEKDIGVLKQKLATNEVKNKIEEHNEEKKKEQQIVPNLSSPVNLSSCIKRDNLLPIESKISFIEKLVCSKMDKLKIQDETSSMKNVFDDILKTNDDCTEWWCPKHSTFLEILNSIKIAEQTVEDQYLIRKAKARFVYWQDKNKNTPRCPTQDRKRGQIIHYQQPKCWP